VMRRGGGFLIIRVTVGVLNSYDVKAMFNSKMSLSVPTFGSPIIGIRDRYTCVHRGRRGGGEVR
jgi:hypothetical protein